jgi:hypothetical protein
LTWRATGSPLQRRFTVLIVLLAVVAIAALGFLVMQRKKAAR